MYFWPRLAGKRTAMRKWYDGVWVFPSEWKKKFAWIPVWALDPSSKTFRAIWFKDVLKLTAHKEANLSEKHRLYIFLDPSLKMALTVGATQADVTLTDMWIEAADLGGQWKWPKRRW